MEYVITDHARAKMRLRGVTEEEVVYVIHNYSTTYPADNSGTTLFGVLADGSSVRLWVAGGLPLQEPVIIKSVVGRN